MKKIILSALMFLISMGAFAQIETPVSWSYAAKRIDKNEVAVLLKATIKAPWHIYSVNQKEGGPVTTSISFASSKEFSFVGKVSEPAPVRKFEKVFGLDVLYFENTVVFQQKIKLLKGKTVVRGKVEFMACNDRECLPPSTVSFSIPVK